MKFGGRIVLIDVERQPLRFGYRLIGSHVTNALGRDSTGEYLDQIYDPEFYERAIGTFKTNIDKRIPLRAYGNMVHAFKPYLRFETIDIPLADDGETVNMILKGSEFSR